MEKLAEVARRFSARPGRQALLRIATEAARELIGAHQAVSSLTEGRTWAQALVAVSLSERYAAWRGYDEKPTGAGIYALVCARNQPLRLTQAELEAHPAYLHFGAARGRHPPLRGWLAAPLVAVDGRNLGLIQLSDKDEGDFTAEDEALLVVLAQMAASAFENERLYEALQEEGRATQAQARLREAITSNATLGLLVLDARQRCTFMNPAAEAITGYTFAEIAGRDVPLHDLVHHSRPDGRPYPMAECPIDRALPTRARVTGEEVFVRKDGTFFPVAFTASPILADGLPVGTVIELQDITERKQTEEALREVERRRREFLAVLSHELRNPLAPIRNALGILERTPLGSGAADRALRVIGRQTDQLTRLVDDLLEVTRMSTNKVRLHLEDVDLQALTARCADDHRPLFEAGRIGFATDLPSEPVWVRGDQVRLRQIVGNLLQNAVKFTPSGEQATLTLRRDAADEQAVLTVSDTGLGIDADTLANVFDAFVQADATLARARGGLGLGLALVHGLVALHGGTVTAASEGPGRGATFEVRLPLGTPPPVPAPTPDASPRQSRRVLVIEDNLDAAETLREVLELEGHEVAVAHGGADGIAKARAWRPEVVLCDIGLPDISGHDVARALRADPALRDTLLVALTGYTQGEHRAQALEAGFDRHLGKPPRLEELERILQGGR